LNVRALAVVNTRAFGGTDTVLEDFKKCKAANEFSYVVPRLPLGPMSVGERVAKCKKEVRLDEECEATSEGDERSELPSASLCNKLILHYSSFRFMAV